MKVAFPFRHHKELFCDEARQRLKEAGFTLVCNDSGEKLGFDEQKELIRGAFAVVAGTERYDRAMLEGCDDLKVIMRFGVGVDNFDLEAMREMGIQAGVIANHNAVAEFTLTLLLASLKSLPLYDAAVRDGRWDRYAMRELSGKTVGIMGFGRIGRRLSELLGGFGVTLLAFDPFINTAEAAARGVEPVGCEELLSRSDIVSLHLPAIEGTRHFINERTIAQMKDGAVLVNTSRGSVVDEAALYKALTDGKLRGAALDVYEIEPVTKDNPLFTLPNVVLAPHVSALSEETNYNGGLICADSIISVLRGGSPVYPVR